MWSWGDAVGKTTVYDAFKRASSGIEYFHFHGLRTFAFELSPGLIWSPQKKLLAKQINMALRCSHPVSEHKAQAVARLGERFKPMNRSQNEVVAPELKEAINAILTPKLKQNRTFFVEPRTTIRIVE
jgi:hypothetical protein